MSMNIRELHGQILSTKVHLVSSGVRGITSNHYQLARPVFAEALIKHPILPKSFGKAFDEIMGEKYGLESVRAGSITRELDLSGTRELMERANLQLHAIIGVLDDIERWIEISDTSFRHSGNLQAFGKNFEECIEKGESFGSDWERIVTAFKTFCAETLLPSYRKSPQLKDYCLKVSILLDIDEPPQSEEQKKVLKRKMDDLMWYFDNFCRGSTESITHTETPPTAKSKPIESTTEEITSQDGAVYGFDGRLRAFPDGSVYVGEERVGDVEASIGKALYALLKKKYGCVSYLDFTHAIHSEKALEPNKARQAAIRRHLSMLGTLLKRYFPDAKIVNEKGKGWYLTEEARKKTAVK